MVHSLMWLDCKMWGKEGTGSEVGKVGTLQIVKDLEYCVELDFYRQVPLKFFMDVNKFLRHISHHFSLKSLQQLQIYATHYFSFDLSFILLLLLHSKQDLIDTLLKNLCLQDEIQTSQCDRKGSSQSSPILSFQPHLQ